MKKRLLAVLLIVVVIATCLTMLVGCENDTDFKIGVLHINPVTSTSGYTYAHQQGIEAMIENLGLKKSQVIIKDSVDDSNTTQINTKIDELIAEGCNMIIGTSYGYMDSMVAAAEANPEIIFSHGTGYKDTFGEGKTNNLNNYFGRIYQARYLSGIVAGLKANQGANIGYVSAFGTTIAECTSGVNAFALGVQAVNPTSKVLVKTLNSWFSIDNETAYAKTLLDDFGCEVIAQHCDTENPPAQAKLAEKFSIGYNSDMRQAIQDESCLTSVVWNWGVYYTKAVEAAMKCFDGNKFTSTEEWEKFGNYYGDYSEGLYGLSDLSSEAHADTAAILALVEAEMKKGVAEWDVFTNTALSFSKNEAGAWVLNKTERQLKDNADNDVTVTVANITGNMPYWIAGVEEK